MLQFISTHPCIFLNIASSRNAQESLELEEAQVRYELEEIKASLVKQLEERDNAHSERIQLMEQVNIRDLHFIQKCVIWIKPSWYKAQTPPNISCR